MTAVTGPGPRILTLDVLRGVAVMGIFSVNVVGFAMPDAAYLNPAAYGGAGGANLAVWVLNFVLIDNKMRCLFSLLFGASLLLVAERAEAAGRSPAVAHYSRMLWLLVFGLVHFYLVWDGDILSLYAPIGMFAYAFRRLPPERLVAAALVFLLMDAAIMVELWRGFAAGEAAAQAPGATQATILQWRSDAEDLIPPTPAELARDLAAYRGGWSGVVAHRWADSALGPVINLMLVGPQTLGLMLLGMAGLRSGFLTGSWAASRYRRIILIGLAIGIPAQAALGWWMWRSGFPGALVFASHYLFALPFYYLQAAAYAAAIVLLARRGGAVVARLAAVGRAAFTNYLGTSLVASGLFFGFGLGLYGRLDRLETWLVAPLVWVLMLLWSKPWLDRFRYGPFEWLWRSLARGRPQPMRR
ncbi:MAG: uncharacterized protein QOG84_2111 [Sphingomonadales bacterium]|nr:uncharacterized protein [Sphingomonadales bacterium]